MRWGSCWSFSTVAAEADRAVSQSRSPSIPSLQRDITISVWRCGSTASRKKQWRRSNKPPASVRESSIIAIATARRFSSWAGTRIPLRSRKPPLSSNHACGSLESTWLGSPTSGRSQRRCRAYAKAVDLETANPEFRNNYGLMLLETGSPDKAIAQFQAAVTADPNNVGAMGNIGLAYLNQGNLTKAIEQFEQVLQLDPTSAAFSTI